MDYKIKRLSDYSDESLLNELKRVAGELSKDTLTTTEFDRHSRISCSTIRKRFGSWNAALKKADLLVERALNISNEELFSEIVKVWGQLGKQPHYKEIGQLGKFSTGYYVKRFGTWSKALEEFSRWKSATGDDSLEDLKEIKPDILLSKPKKGRRAKTSRIWRTD